MELPILFSAPSGARAGAVADLLARDHEVLRTADLATALAECHRQPPAAAVLPFPGEAGEEELLRTLREEGRRTAVFLYSVGGPPPQHAALRALAAGACGVLDATAPDFTDDLRRRLTRLMRNLRVRRREDETRARLFRPHHVVGASPAMHDVFRRALKASQFSDLPVLIEGDTGTPKRRLAAAILSLDPVRVRMPFFALGCADIPRLLLSRRGPVGGEMGSVAAKWRDLLRAARGGTVFLDEVGRLEPELQHILLEVVRQRSSDLRVIAATTRPALDLIESGHLDGELCAWLGLFRILLPSLRGRPEDIAAQTWHTLRTTPARSATPVSDLGPGVLEALQRLPWEGNHQELEAVLRQALATKEGGTTLLMEDLPDWAREVNADLPPPAPVPHPGDWMSVAAGQTGHPIDSTAEEYERWLLRRVLSRQRTGEGAGRHEGPG
jgi:DNA-binding NtrC family response regulator